MDRFLVLCFVASLSFCQGNIQKNTRDGGLKMGMDKFLLNWKISELLNVNPRLEKRKMSCYHYEKSKEYDGWQSTTVSGRTCQHWNTNSPHQVPESYIPTDAPDSNYCRDMSDHGAPWCYTTDKDVRWETCAVNTCNKDEGNECDAGDCYNYGKSDEYAGVKSTTISGRTCQRWNTQCPHEPQHVPSDSKDLESNFCRDVSDTGTPWCYTTDKNVRWEFCEIPVCQ